MYGRRQRFGASVTRSARIAGAVYLLIMVLALVTVDMLDSTLIVAGDAATTASNLMASDSLFRAGIVGTLLLYASVVVLAGLLYTVLESVDAELALLAMLLRVAEGVLGATSALISLAVALLMDGVRETSAADASRAVDVVGLLVDWRHAALDVVLVFVGLGGTLFCYLFYKSRYVPRWLAAWGVFTYLSMLGLALLSIVVPDHPLLLETLLYGAGGLFELVFGAWLLVKAVDLGQLKTANAQGVSADASQPIS